MIPLIVLVPGCATTLAVRSSPTGAQVLLTQCGGSGTTDSELTIPAGVFQSGSTATEVARFTLPGYRMREVSVSLAKGKPNVTSPEVVQLERLDSRLLIKSSPSGARITFNLPDELLPPEWKRQLRTPAEFLCTPEEARRLLQRGLALDEVEMEGYFVVPVGEARPGQPIALEPGGTKSLSLQLDEITTTLHVETDPPGAFVEDDADGGFGYLGTTPLARQFAWRDVSIWAQRREIRDFTAIELSLRIQKRGYEDVRTRVSVPVGQTRAFVRPLQPRAKLIHFSSDPPGASIFVERTRTGQKVTESLGTTPVVRDIAEAKPFQAGDVFIFMLPGHEDVESPFIEGKYHYHEVLKPVNTAPR
jgi:hypothetical protein